MKRLKEEHLIPIYEYGERLKVLFESALDGDENAYRTFLEQTALVVRRFLKRTVKGEFSSEASVEDLVQEVLLTIHRKRGLYQRGQPILPWIKTITRYRLIDSIRSSQRRPEFVGFDENFDEAVSAESTPDLQAEAEELMAPLSEKQKEVLKLAKLEGLSHAEISSRTGLSIAAVKVSIHRSLNQIRKSLYEKK